MKALLGFWLAGLGLVASAALGASSSLLLEWGPLETDSGEQQAVFHVWRSSARAPVVQRLTARGTSPWLVQFNAVIREEWKTALETEGAAIQGYIPENGFLVIATPEAIVRIGMQADVAWVGEYLPAYKIATIMRAGWSVKSTEVHECRVRLFQSEDKARIVRELGEMNVSISQAEVQSERVILRAWLSPKQVEEVANWGEVEWIELYRKPQVWGASDVMGSSDAPDDGLQSAIDSEARIRLVNQGVADAGAYGVVASAFDQFVWEHPEVLVVAAAGNAATDLNPADGVVDAGSVGSPATAKNALAVGAAEGQQHTTRVWRDSWPEDFAVQPIALDRMTQPEGAPGLAAFSGRGPCADGRIKPDLVAPGTFIVVSRSRHATDLGWGVADNTNEIYVGGTGVAAEQVAEAAKQARQWLAEARGLTSPSAALVKGLLINGARDLAPGQYGMGPKQEIPSVRPNSAQGFGRLDLAGALQPGEGEFLDLHDALGLVTGAADVFELNVSQAGGRFVLTLAYSDYGATPSVSRKLVNDLDLTVRKPSGTLLHANGHDVLDAENNVEMIEFAADEAGNYVARVEARTVPMGGSQPYALVVRGPRIGAASVATMEKP